MPSDNSTPIPKITPTSEAQTGDSILLPKNEEPVVKTNQVNTPQMPQVPKTEFKYKKLLMGLGIFLLIVILDLVVGGLLMYNSAKKLADNGQKLQEKIKAGDLAGAQTEIPLLKKNFKSLKSSYTVVSWTRVLPFIGGYSSDLSHVIKAGEAGVETFEIVLPVIEPYADTLGFTNKSETDGEKTTQERIDFIVNAIPDLLPKIDEISAKVSLINTEIAQINPDRYKYKFKGMNLADRIHQIQELIGVSTNFIVNGKPVLESAPYLLGMDSPRNYLVLFQNDKELRPTGGFMTAYSLVTVDKAKFEPTISEDIYSLDAKYKPSIKAPDPIIDYIKGPYILSKNLRLRDMNWSPDFEESMDMFSEAVSEVGVKGVDGIISVDTQVLVNLLDVLGPIGVPGFGNFSNNIEPECNCPQVIYELESYADVEGPIVWDPVSGEIVYKPKNSDNRKKIIGPLMNSVLANALGQPKEKLPALFTAATNSLMEKHVLFYMFDEKAQKGLADFGWAGKINDYEGDYLHINDANLGGRKSNLYVTQEVHQEIEIDKGEITKTVTITYKNPEKYDGWLNSVLPNWVRVYVPKGSELIVSEGLEDKVDPYEELGKTVFAGLFQLRPEGVSKVTFKYKLPFKAGKVYSMYIQKQPGTDANLQTIMLGKYEDEFLLNTDREIKIRI